MAKPLIVLDMNGVLCTGVGNKRKLRLGAEDFVLALLNHYEVGVLSSTKQKNVLAVIQATRFYQKLSFVFCRGYCPRDIDPDAKSHETMKPLSVVFRHFPNHSYDDTIIVDDSPKKVRMNPADNVVICDENISFVGLFQKIVRSMNKLQAQ